MVRSLIVAALAAVAISQALLSRAAIRRSVRCWRRGARDHAQRGADDQLLRTDDSLLRTHHCVLCAVDDLLAPTSAYYAPSTAYYAPIGRAGDFLLRTGHCVHLVLRAGGRARDVVLFARRCSYYYARAVCAGSAGPQLDARLLVRSAKDDRRIQRMRPACRTRVLRPAVCFCDRSPRRRQGN